MIYHYNLYQSFEEKVDGANDWQTSPVQNQKVNILGLWTVQPLLQLLNPDLTLYCRNGNM